MLETFEGGSAWSEFRRLPLLEACRRVVPKLENIEATFFYMALLNRGLDAVQRGRLEEILALPARRPGDMDQVLIGPRCGTISPWSSKATDILHNCGLDEVDRIERGTLYRFVAPDGLDRQAVAQILPLLFDRMTEAVVDDPAALFAQVEPQRLARIGLMEQGRGALKEANTAMGLALSLQEIDYFAQVFEGLKRNPTDVELMMFSVVNSEHCRHKIFNASWCIDGEAQSQTLFDMIRHTHASHPDGCIKAYSDNAGIIQGFEAEVFRPWETAGFHSLRRCFQYGFARQQTHIVIKVETHNHPTAISPYPGASTGVGGEIRDEGATGVGGQSQAGLCAFFTSHLRLPGWLQPWEKEHAEFPQRLATPLEIMTEGPIGGAAFGNEFGRPNILGVFRTMEESVAGRYRGYHKPIMVAGGVGLIDAEHVEKQQPEVGDYVVQIGGPAMLIGLGGGAASSMDTGSNQEDLDFASVQRDNPEMERRCQELINRCIALGQENPILSIHDIGAGGLSNGCPELVEAVGARFDLRAINNADPGMSPMQIWCNEAQERYVLIVGQSQMERFATLGKRERCPVAMIGQVSGDGRLSLRDPLLGEDPIEALDLEVILGKPPRLERQVERLVALNPPLDLTGVDLQDAVGRVLRFPAVANKTFLITIADRTVTGLVARDQMVGPYQTPIADVAVTATGFKGYTGSAMAMGERAPLALIDAPASGRMAIGEALSNIAAARIGPIGHIKLSANWMCACGEAGEDANLFDTVKAVGLEFCPGLGLAIPVGKDSLSMRAVWQDSDGQDHKIVAPLSLVISAFAPVEEIRATLTPDLKPGPDSRLLLIDLGKGANRLGGSALAQVYNQIGAVGPDVAPQDMRFFYDAIQALNTLGLLMAYHDRSDGGLFVTLAEMGFGGRLGMRVDITALGADPLAALFNEEIGAVLQYAKKDEAAVLAVLNEHHLGPVSHVLGAPNDHARLEIFANGQDVFNGGVRELLQTWSELSYRMQALRDNPDCAREEFESLAAEDDPGLSFTVPFRVVSAAVQGVQPKVAVLREQGINGQVEMAAAFDLAGFDAFDVTMTDLLEGRTDLADFQGLVACGGFSYGDVLGAGVGWARSILFNDGLSDMFAAFFKRQGTFGLGVCNGCQMMAHLKELIPGTTAWPRFERNRSEQFEARYATVEVLQSRSVLLRDMAGARLGIAVAHGEGRAEFSDGQIDSLEKGGQVCMRFVDNYGRPTQRYPYNPNGSLNGITALASADGRVTIMMPHPERVFRSVQLSWRPAAWQDEAAPWFKLFQNARSFVDQS